MITIFSSLKICWQHLQNSLRRENYVLNTESMTTVSPQGQPNSLSYYSFQVGLGGLQFINGTHMRQHHQQALIHFASTVAYDLAPHQISFPLSAAWLVTRTCRDILEHGLKVQRIL